MTTTTGDPSTLKSPASLSGGDLVSRLLAATPPYLYNVPLTPHSFFFSEMLRSFVQAKTEASTTGNTTNVPRRRKRSWRDARDRPLELTTKEKQQQQQQQQHHHHHHHQQPPDKYFHAQQQQQQQQQQETRLENRSKQSDGYEPENKVASFEQKTGFGPDILKPLDENKPDFSKQSKGFFDERPRQFEQAQPPETTIFSNELQKVKPEEAQSADRKNCNYAERSAYEERSKGTMQNQELSLLADQKKLDFSRNFLPGLPGRGCDVLQGVKGFGLPGNATNPDSFLPNPLWYPPYPMPQSYPAIDPLHFFIDLRVSGHIWDRKLSERQLPFKGKHCSAFSVPQSKEYSNRPLNLTRDEASTSRTTDENLRGTNYILRHLTRTYRDIHQTRKGSRSETSTGEHEESSKETNECERSMKSEETASTSTSQEDERKDLRALIGLELVVDYVKEPKADPSNEQASQVNE